MNFSGKKIVVTGGGGFLGSHIVDELKKHGADNIFVPRSKTHDLRKPDVCADIAKDADIIIHAAATVGGIGANKENPGTFFYDNAMMGINLIEEARKADVEKFVCLGTICAYPKYTPVPFKEEDLWNGYPEETNAPYGIAKKALMVQLHAYREQYGFNGVFLLPVNLYGPRDNFDPKSSHVIPALIKKFYDAKLSGQDSVVVWGDGSPTREFLYVEDAAKGIVLATKHYNKHHPVNLGSSHEISIKDLVNTIARLMDFNGKIVWDITRPNGQPRRKLDVSRAEEEFGFKSETSFEEGLKKTIGWYVSERQNNRIE